MERSRPLHALHGRCERLTLTWGRDGNKAVPNPLTQNLKADAECSSYAMSSRLRTLKRFAAHLSDPIYQHYFTGFIYRSLEDLMTFSLF